MGSKMSTSLVSISTRRNPKVFSRIVSEAEETFVDSKFLFFNWVLLFGLVYFSSCAFV